MTRYQLHRSDWIGCTRCSLSEKRHKVCLVRGTLPCDLLFIGEAPGPSEDVIGKPFIGPAGSLLDQIIVEALEGYSLTHALTNLVGCIPLDDSGDKFTEPPQEAILACRPRLEELASIAKPRLIVTVGALAAKWLDRVIPKREARSVNITHPAAILRMNVAMQGLAVQKCVVNLSNAIEDL